MSYFQRRIKGPQDFALSPANVPLGTQGPQASGSTGAFVTAPSAVSAGAASDCRHAGLPRVPLLRLRAASVKFAARGSDCAL